MAFKGHIKVIGCSFNFIGLCIIDHVLLDSGALRPIGLLYCIILLLLYLYIIQHQYLTVLSLELHIETRGDLRPDPEFDPVVCIFYSIFNDVPAGEGQRKVTGVMIVDKESAEQEEILK